MRLVSGLKVIVLVVTLGLGGTAMGQQVEPETWRLNNERLSNDGRQVEAEHVPDPARGEKLFKECRKCHAVEPSEVKIGPSLAGIVGRRPGSMPAFGYSQDMIDFGTSGAVWDDESLDRFLTRPRALIAGTKMVFQGFRRPNDREDLIAYLATIRG